MNYMEYALEIIKGNEDIFDKQAKIYEISAGFNNKLFNVDDKYIIKICINDNLSDKFKKEASFYKLNKGDYIGKLYKYDDSKSIIPYVYEIIEKIDGMSLYYYWYKMNENLREETIKKLVYVLKDFHKPIKNYNFANFLKSQLRDYLNKSQKYFNSEEVNVIKKVIDILDRYFVDEKIVTIHNDLHFDNIIYNNIKIYLIDFNDLSYGPIDYDLRYLYFCQFKPWKWANEEMDSFQKVEDFKNIFNYLIKYYDELSIIKNIDDRMIIYMIVDDMRLFSKSYNSELKDSVLNNSKKLIYK